MGSILQERAVRWELIASEAGEIAVPVQERLRAGDQLSPGPPWSGHLLSVSLGPPDNFPQPDGSPSCQADRPIYRRFFSVRRGDQRYLDTMPAVLLPLPGLTGHETLGARGAEVIGGNGPNSRLDPQF